LLPIFTKKILTELRTLMEARGFFRIPLKKLKTGHYKLTARINGNQANLILDTGASSSCIGFKSASLFHLKTEKSEIKAAGAGAINMETLLSKKNIIKLGKKKIGGVEFVLFDLSHVNEAIQQADEASVHGILGADQLKALRAVIDYGRNSLYIL
jgi:hypothetical protein